MRYLKALSIPVLLLVSTLVWSAQKPTLTVYTYDSFASEWGPGPAIKERFEANCECTLQYVAADSSTGILNRVRLEGNNSSADIVLGLDATQTAEAKAADVLAPHNQDLSALKLPVEWQDEVFVPFDYGYFAFIYKADKISQPPTSLQALAESDYSVIVQDPRSSTPGLGLLLWTKRVMGDDADAWWSAMSDNLITITKGWSEAYGLFQKDESDFVLSYTTSPAYHLIAEEDANYQAAAFEEGHGLQIEVAAKLKNSQHSDLADQFLAFILTDGFQSAIPTGNWMYPVITLKQGLPAGFEKMIQPTHSHWVTPEDFVEHKPAWIDEYLQAVTQ